MCILVAHLSLVLGAQTTSFPVASYVVSRIAGTPQMRIDGAQAAEAMLQRPFSLAQDRSGNVYISDASGLNMITPAGQYRLLTGDRNPNPRISVNTALLANDPTGEILIATGTQIVRRFSDGRQVLLAGGGARGTFADAIPATQADLGCISGLTIDRAGNIYYSCRTLGIVRRIGGDGIIRTVAGTFTPGSNGDGGPAVRAQITPSHLAVDNTNALLIYDAAFSSVRRITLDGVINTVAGGGSSVADGVLAVTARIEPVGGMSVDGNSFVYLSEPTQHRIRRFTVGSTISLFAGSSGAPGDVGDGGSIGGARFNSPTGLFTDRDGALLIADTGNHRVRRVSGNFVPSITAYAGVSHYRGDGGRGVDAMLNGPASVTVDSNGNVNIADTNNSRIRRVTLNGIINTVAGNGAFGTAGDGAAATAAQLRSPSSVAASQTTIHIADTDRVRSLTANGNISLLTQIANIGPIAADAQGNVYAATATSITIISNNGATRTIPVATDGRISGIAVDGLGNIIVTDDLAHVVRRISGSAVQLIAGSPNRPGNSGDGAAAVSALLNSPKAVAADTDGNIFIADASGSLIRRISRDGVIRTVAGSLTTTSDPLLAGQALNAAFGQITGLAVDSTGAVYFADSGLDIVGKLAVQKPGKVVYVSGDNQTGGTDSVLVDKLVVKLVDDDGIPVTGVPMDFYVTSGIAFPDAPNVLTGVDGTAAMGIRLGANPGTVKVAASTLGLAPVTFTITIIPRGSPSGPGGTNYSLITYAGMPYPSDDGALLQTPDSIAVDSEGTIYFSDSATHRILARGKDGPVRPFAGTGVRGAGTARDFGYRVRLNNPTGVTTGPNFNIYFADRDNNRICRITGDQVFEVVLADALKAPSALAIDAAGQIYIADTGNFRIRLLRTDNTIADVAGNGTQGATPDGQPAAGSPLGVIRSLAIDANGTLYFVEDGALRYITADGTLATLPDTTGLNAVTFDTKGAMYLATATQITRIAPDATVTAIAKDAVSGPRGLTADALGTLYIADTGNHLIRRYDASGSLDTLTGRAFTNGDGEQSVLTVLNAPGALAVDSTGNLYIGEATSRTVRRVSPEGVIRTIATNIDAVAAATDNSGNIYIGTAANELRRIDRTGSITTIAISSNTPITRLTCLSVSPANDVTVCNANTVQRLQGPVLSSLAGTGTAGFGGDGGPGQFGLINAPASAVYDANGALYIADRGNLRVRKLANGVISTIAGTGRRGGPSVDGGQATDADLDDVIAVAVDTAGNVYIAEANRIRKVSPTGVIATIAGTRDFGFDSEEGTGAEARFDGITSMVIDASGNLYVADGNNHRVRKLTPQF